MLQVVAHGLSRGYGRVEDSCSDSYVVADDEWSRVVDVRWAMADDQGCRGVLVMDEGVLVRGSPRAVVDHDAGLYCLVEEDVEPDIIR